MLAVIKSGFKRGLGFRVLSFWVHREENACGDVDKKRLREMMCPSITSVCTCHATATELQHAAMWHPVAGSFSQRKGPLLRGMLNHAL